MKNVVVNEVVVVKEGIGNFLQQMGDVVSNVYEKVKVIVIFNKSEFFGSFNCMQDICIVIQFCLDFCYWLYKFV